MILITAVIKPFALGRRSVRHSYVGIAGMTVSEVKGFGWRERPAAPRIFPSGGVQSGVRPRR